MPEHPNSLDHISSQSLATGDVKKTEPASSTDKQARFAVFTSAFGFLLFLQWGIRKWLPDSLFKDFYFQSWSSDDMMQTLPILNLQQQPWESLWTLHKQPPMLDMIRTLLAHLSPQSSNPGLLLSVDSMMYIVWAIFYALLTMLIFIWARAQLGKGLPPYLLALVWILYPGSLAMATMLDGTMLSALLVTWLLYELWCINKDNGSTWRLAVAVILLYLTRTIFQWYFLPVLLLALLVARTPFQRIIKVLAPWLVVLLVFSVKQWFLFGSISTTTFAGEHKLGMIGYHPTQVDLRQLDKPRNFHYPDIQFAVEDSFNTRQQVQNNLIYSDIFKNRLSCCTRETLLGVSRSIRQNFSAMLLPTSSYRPNAITSPLPWNGIDILFSGSRLVVLFSLAVGGWFFRHRKHLGSAYIPAFAPWIVVAYIFSIILLANRYEWTEADRLKFFLEPALFVWITTQFTLLWRDWRLASSKSAL